MTLAQKQSDRIAARWKTVGQSVFSEMTALAKLHNAVNLGQGAPDFYGPQEILNAISCQLFSCHNQYAPAAGEERLRVQVSEFIQQTSGVKYNPADEITITNGASGAVYCAINAFVNPGDKVLVLEPGFDLYYQAIASAGGQVVPVRLHAPDSPVGLANNGAWAIDWQELEKVSAAGFSFAIFNSPHNPTGKIFSKEEMDKIAFHILKNNALVLTDEVYENFTFNDATHVSLCTYPDLRHLVLRASSAAKTFGFTGLKVGWISAPAKLSEALRIVQQSTVFCVSPFTQLGLADMMEQKSWLSAYLQAQKKDYLQKRDFMASLLREVGFSVSLPEGSFFITANYKNLYGTVQDLQCAKEMVKNKQVATIPLTPFYSDPPKNLTWLRFAFCKKEETLRAAADLLLK